MNVSSWHYYIMAYLFEREFSFDEIYFKIITKVYLLKFVFKVKIILKNCYFNFIVAIKIGTVNNNTN